MIDIDMVKDQLSFTSDMGTVDDDLLERKLAAAQNHVESLLGYTFSSRFDEESPPVEIPPALVEAVCQLAAFWYDADPVASEKQFKSLPFGFESIINEFRDRSF